MFQDFKQYIESIYGRDISVAKYKIGQEVLYRYYDKDLENYMELITEITAVNYMYDDELGNPVIEYALKDWNFLVYENELEKIE